MKTSNKIIITTGAIPLLAVFIFALVLKLMPLEAKVSDATLVDKSSWITRTFPLSDFHNIFANGFWDVHISQAEDYLVEIKAPEEILEMISVEKVDGTLILDYLDVRKQSKNHPKVEVLVHLPSLSEINMNGMSDLELQEMTIDSVKMHTVGIIKVSGSDTTIETLFFDCNGMSKIDLSKTKVINADIDCDGIFHVDLLMNGGELQGSLNGMGALSILGRVGRMDMKQNSPFCTISAQGNVPGLPEPPFFQQGK